VDCVCLSIICFCSAREFIVYIGGSECCSEVDGLWVCEGDKLVQVTADAMLYTILRWQVLIHFWKCVAVGSILVSTVLVAVVIFVALLIINGFFLKLKWNMSNLILLYFLIIGAPLIQLSHMVLYTDDN